MLKSDLVDCIEKEMNSQQIADYYSVSYSKIRYWLKKYDLKTKAITVSEKWREDNLKEIIKNSLNYSDALRSMGVKDVTGGNFRQIKKYVKKYGIDTSHFKRTSSSSNELSIKETFKKGIFRSGKMLRGKIEKYGLIKYECMECGNTGNWNGKKLTLHLDHINGDRKDNRLENLRFLCPNCHQQTDTWGAKNMKKNRIKYSAPIIEKCCKMCKTPFKFKKTKRGRIYCSDKCSKEYMSKHIPLKNELLQIMVEKKGVFLQVASYYGVSDNAVRKWCKKYNIPHKRKELRQYIKNISI